MFSCLRGLNARLCFWGRCIFRESSSGRVRNARIREQKKMAARRAAKLSRKAEAREKIEENRALKYQAKLERVAGLKENSASTLSNIKQKVDPDILKEQKKARKQRNEEIIRQIRELKALEKSAREELAIFQGSRYVVRSRDVKLGIENYGNLPNAKWQ